MIIYRIAVSKRKDNSTYATENQKMCFERPNESVSHLGYEENMGKSI